MVETILLWSVSLILLFVEKASFGLPKVTRPGLRVVSPGSLQQGNWVKDVLPGSLHAMLASILNFMK